MRLLSRRTRKPLYHSEFTGLPPGPGTPSELELSFLLRQKPRLKPKGCHSQSTPSARRRDLVTPRGLGGVRLQRSESVVVLVVTRTRTASASLRLSVVIYYLAFVCQCVSTSNPYYR